jgi:hypothetical protein
MDDARVREFLEQIGGWEGFEVVEITTEDSLAPDALGLPAPRLIIQLQPKADAPKRCSRCGEIVVEIHDVSERRVRDLPIGEYTWLMSAARLHCPRLARRWRRTLDRYQHDYAVSRQSRPRPVLPITCHVSSY